MDLFLIRISKDEGKNTIKNWWRFSIDQILCTRWKGVNWNGQATHVESKIQWYKECSEKTQGAKDHSVDQGWRDGIRKDLLNARGGDYEDMDWKTERNGGGFVLWQDGFKDLKKKKYKLIILL